MWISKLLIIIVLSVSSGAFAQNLAEGLFTYDSCSLQYIKIEGETNINRFNLIFDNSRLDIVSIKEKERIGKAKPDIIEFKIPVKGFKGGNYLMENDFQDLLKASVYPLIIVGIKEKTFEHILSGSVGPEIDFYLTIAGNTRNISGKYVTYCKDDEIVLNGSAKIRLTDFSIDPPQKMFGMLQVKDIIIIKFDISIPAINS